MKHLFTRLFCISVVQLTAATLCYAQTKPVQNILQPPPPNITIDGDLQDWGDSLRYFNADKQIHYSLANDKENLYIAVRINDRTEQLRVLNAGLTLSIDTRGKKKESFTLTFPIAQTGVPMLGMERPDNGDLAKEDKDELMQARLTKLREIKVSGFKDIEDDVITTSNTYGIKTAVDYDKDDYLVYEAAIPLKFFHVDDITKSEWAFNFKINGITKPGQNKNGGNDEGPSKVGGGGGGLGGGGRGGGGGGKGGGGRGGQRGGNSAQADHNELSKSVDFWEKYYLAK
ncbi:MAG TPA: hypothetical protein VK668_05065 [Mucilaginibacter sp.]|nr:hypothetical protein [Mucilaginibacter sp.]